MSAVINLAVRRSQVFHLFDWFVPGLCAHAYLHTAASQLFRGQLQHSSLPPHGSHSLDAINTILRNSDCLTKAVGNGLIQDGLRYEIGVRKRQC